MTRSIALGRLTPRALRVVALRLALAAAVRVIDRVHRHPAHARTPPEPSRAAGLAVRDVAVVEIADLTDGGAAGALHQPELAGRQLEQRVLAFLRHQLNGRPGPAAELTAAARAQLDVVHDRSERHLE